MDVAIYSGAARRLSVQHLRAQGGEDVTRRRHLLEIVVFQRISVQVVEFSERQPLIGRETSQRCDQRAQPHGLWCA